MSVARIFGSALGDPIADDIMRALHEAGSAGMTRTAIRDLFGRHRASDRINLALALLAAKKRARMEKEINGRPPGRDLVRNRGWMTWGRYLDILQRGERDVSDIGDLSTPKKNPRTPFGRFGRFGRDPRQFCQAADALERRCPDHVDHERWQQAIADARRFLRRWSKKGRRTRLDRKGFVRPPPCSRDATGELPAAIPI